jgi:hypothetical protein
MKTSIQQRGLILALTWLSAGVQGASQKLDIRLPLRANSVRFAVIGDSGTGGKEQYDVARQMELYRETVGFGFVLMLGDNIYGGHEPRDFRRKFELPYEALLASGVEFYAALGNHDDPKIESLYKPFHMNGQRYYDLKKGDVEFFALDSNYMDTQQLGWLEDHLRSSRARWKICYFHHPLYNDGRMHGPDVDLRNQLTPLLKAYGVNVVFSGHEHAYERIKPEDNIYYFIQGSSGQLFAHDFRRHDVMERGYDRDRTFMLVEISGDQLYFQTISRTGETVDAGELARQTPAQRAGKAAREAP